jgi:hypothetical protein
LRRLDIRKRLSEKFASSVLRIKSCRHNNYIGGFKDEFASVQHCRRTSAAKVRLTGGGLPLKSLRLDGDNRGAASYFNIGAVRQSLTALDVGEAALSTYPQT